MSGFTSPAASPIALPARAAAPSVLAPGVPGLAAFIDLMMGKLAPAAAKGAPGDDKGQDSAETGKILPDEDKPQVDPTLAWLFGAPPMSVAQPIAIAVPQIIPPVICAVEPEKPFPVAVAMLPTAPVGKETPSPATPQVEDPLPAISSATLPNKPDVSPPLAPPKTVAPPVMPLPPVAPPAATLPALFALAMVADRDARDEMTPSPTPAAPILQPVAAAPIAPASDAQRQTLDLGRQDWPQKMIDHIEALRDNANANDTSIRLKPEVLGQVDVSLKTHGDGAISIRFTADQPTTRILLLDAAPQLTAAAEARGIRLSGTSVDLGGQGDQRPRPEIERPQNISNHLAAPRGDDNQAVDDGRIA